METSYRFVVSGSVQGVGYRAAAQRAAMKFGLRGWVRNLADGRVEGLASGSTSALAAFRAWLGRGPPASAVTSVDWTSTDPFPETGFDIRP